MSLCEMIWVDVFLLKSATGLHFCRMFSEYNHHRMSNRSPQGYLLLIFYKIHVWPEGNMKEIFNVENESYREIEWSGLLRINVLWRGIWTHFYYVTHLFLHFKPLYLF